VWRYRGTPPYLTAQAKRLGISQVLADRARHNPEIHRASVLLGQLCERCHKARKEDGRPVLLPPELQQIRGTLEQVEQECAKLHALAGAVTAMLDEAWAAFNLEPPARHFEVLCDYDVPTIPLPVGDGTVNVSGPALGAKRC
jgi:hypothetical protein